MAQEKVTDSRTNLFTREEMYRYVGSKGLISTPVGSINVYAGSTEPAGWVFCDGTSYTEVAQPDLFAIIGITYGGGGGSFNVPDLRGRVPLALDNLGGVSADRITNSQADSLGGNAGAENHTHSLSNAGYVERLALTATGLFHNKTAGTGPTVTGTGLLANTQGQSQTHPRIDLGGATDSEDSTQPWIALTYIIKT